jgi:hypothetical protein
MDAPIITKEKDQKAHMEWMKKNRNFLTHGDVFWLGDAYPEYGNIWGVVVYSDDNLIKFSKLWNNEYHPSAPISQVPQNGLFIAIRKIEIK